MTMLPLDAALAEALDCALREDYASAKKALADRHEPPAVLLAVFIDREMERQSAIKAVRHEMGNALSIAQASLEAMLDGVVPITDPRLRRVREIIEAVGNSMHDMWKT